MLDRAQGVVISGQPQFTNVGGDAVTIQTGVTNVIRSQPGAASESETIWAKLMSWSPENACKTSKRELDETLDILEDFHNIIPHHISKTCQEQEMKLRAEYREVAALVAKKSLGSYLVDKSLKTRLARLRTGTRTLYKRAVHGSQDGRNQILRSRLEELEKKEMNLATDSNDQLFTSDDESSSCLPPPDDTEEGYETDSSFATCRTSVPRNVAI